MPRQQSICFCLGVANETREVIYMYSIQMYDEKCFNWTDIYISDNYILMKKLYNKIVKKYSSYSFRFCKTLSYDIGSSCVVGV